MMQPALIHDNARFLERNMKTNWLLKMVYHVTGGRPMKRECSAFYDSVANEPVYFFRDRLRNVRYMATHKWALFRVETGNQG
jgi:hypothetical protein